MQKRAIIGAGMRKKTSLKKPQFKLTKGNVIAIVTALIAGTCTLIASCIGLAAPIISIYFEAPQTQTPSPAPLPTNVPVPTQLNDSIRLEPVGATLYNCSVGEIYAVPDEAEIPPIASGNNPLERYYSTKNYLDEKGFFIVADSLIPDELDIYDPRSYAKACTSTYLSINTIFWNTSLSRLFIKEVTLIVEAYDYEPSRIPNDYKTVILIPPQYGGSGNGIPGPTPIPYQSFQGELRSTSNSFPFMSMSNNPPIIIESGIPVQFEINMMAINAGTFRMHLSFNVEDSNGEQVIVDSESFVIKFALINNLDRREIIPIDVK